MSRRQRAPPRIRGGACRLTRTTHPNTRGRSQALAANAIPPRPRNPARFQFSRPTVKIAHDALPTIPQIFLHNTYTGKNPRFLLLYFRYLLESKDLERVKGIEPSS